MPRPWNFSCSHLPTAGTVALTARRKDAPVTFLDLLRALVDDATARDSLLDAWRSVPHPGYVWEMPALTASTIAKPFESVAVCEPALDVRPANPTAFRDYLEPHAATAFPNLGRDAWLIAPGRGGPEQDSLSGHLAAFARGASKARTHHLLSSLGTTALEHIAEDPRWISTNGLGVAWLHFRIDQSPKYYRHAPYRQAGYLRRE